MARGGIYLQDLKVLVQGILLQLLPLKIQRLDLIKIIKSTFYFFNVTLNFYAFASVRSFTIDFLMSQNPEKLFWR